MASRMGSLALRVALLAGLVLVASASRTSMHWGGADKKARLGIRLTMAEGVIESCPRDNKQVTELREFVGETLLLLLKNAGVKAKVKVGVLACLSDHNKEYSETHRRVRMTFVASLVPQGGSKHHGLKSFVASLKHLQDSKGVCSSGDSYIDCDDNHVGAFEFVELNSVPKDVKLIAVKPSKGSYGYGHSAHGHKSHGHHHHKVHHKAHHGHHKSEHYKSSSYAPKDSSYEVIKHEPEYNEPEEVKYHEPEQPAYNKPEEHTPSSPEPQYPEKHEDSYVPKPVEPKEPVKPEEPIKPVAPYKPEDSPAKDYYGKDVVDSDGGEEDASDDEEDGEDDEGDEDEYSGESEDEDDNEGEAIFAAISAQKGQAGLPAAAASAATAAVPSTPAAAASSTASSVASSTAAAAAITTAAATVKSS